MEMEDLENSQQERKDSSSSPKGSSASELSTDSKENYANITGILMSTFATGETSRTAHMETDTEQQTEAESVYNVDMNQQEKRPKRGHWFTFDDIPMFKRRERMLEISAWVDLQRLKPNFNFEAIL